MKKLSTLILGCALTLVLSACQKPMHSSENNPSSAIAPGESSGTTSTSQDTSEIIETTYSVVFLNYDNTLLYEATNIKRGKPAIYGGQTPTRPDTDEYKYEFIGWDKNLTAIYSDLAVYAQYNAIKKAEPSIPEKPSMAVQGYQAVQNANGMNLAFAGIFQNKYYGYFFDLGVVKTTPIYSSTAITYLNQDYGIEFIWEECTSETLSRSMSTATQTIHTDSNTKGFTIEPEVEVFGVSVKLGSYDHHWTHEDTTSVEKSESNERSYTNTYSKGLRITIDFSEENGFRRQYTYRISFFETIRCYGVLLYDFEEDKYSYFYETLLDSSNKVMVLEESSNTSGEFNYEINSNLEFDLDQAIEIAKNEEYKFDKLVRLDNQNGTESFANIYLDNKGNYMGTKPSIPTLNNKVFLGYFSEKELGKGDCYIDANMKVVKKAEQNMTLFAHWSDPSHSVTNHEAGADNTYKSKGNNETSDWNGLWKGESKAFTSGFKTSEAVDAIKGGYKYVQVKVRMDTYEEVDGWEWVSFRTRKNDALYRDLQIFKISVVTKSWKSVIFNFTFDASYLTDSSITYQLVYGVTGNGNNEWKRGYTTTSMTLVKEAITPYAEETIDGGPYSL